MASIAGHHAEWLSLLDVSGPFLSVPVLIDALPNGLDAHDSSIAAELRAAMDQLADPELAHPGSIEAVDLHMAFVRFVMHGVLGFDDDVLVWDPTVTSGYAAEIRPGVELAPDAVVLDGGGLQMLVSVIGPLDRVDKPVPGDAWATSPQDRMAEQLKSLGCRLGLVTDGERWTLVSVREGDNPGFATWWASLWREEKITLQAFRTLLGQPRFVSVAEHESLAALLDRSAEDQREVTTKLGNQTLDAVEILIRTIDQIDRDKGGELLAEVEEAELYDAAVTVMMRLIFLFFAEENDLLPTSEPLYNERYAASTLRNRLQEAADQFGEEVLESTSDGWPRLLATWRAVFAGVDHSDMVLAPYGGSLFDPDRYPFLEGRLPGSSWIESKANPLPIDNRTVLHLLNALQTLDEGGQRRKLSFRALDVEQIGHVYEGMLDHTAARAKGWVLGLSGTGGKAPEVELDDLDALDDKALVDSLKGRTGRTVASLKKWMSDDESGKAIEGFGMTWSPAFSGESSAVERAERFARLIRPDSTGTPTVFQPGSVYVADSSHRGATGTHYTPRSLTEEMVEHALDPLVYLGPSDGAPETDWELRPAGEILGLKICDPACGSGAFLVQACRYLSEKVVEARRLHGDVDTDPTEDELIEARREVAERCLYGVDINPMACEMAKLSLWLYTLARDKPFTFVDHAIRCGDSLLGISDIDQLTAFHILPAMGQGNHSKSLFDITATISEILLRGQAIVEQIAGTRTQTMEQTTLKIASLEGVEGELEPLKRLADIIVEERLLSSNWSEYGRRIEIAGSSAAAQLEAVLPPRNYFHWPLEFPSVKSFDSIIGNPPFLPGSEIAAQYGQRYAEYVRSCLTSRPATGRADLVTAFIRRSLNLVDQGASEAATIGLLATASIIEGQSLDGGLAIAEADGFRLYRACSPSPWPGAASVSVVRVWLESRATERRRFLNSEEVDTLSVRLRSDEIYEPELQRIQANASLCFEGWKPYGSGFVLDADERTKLIDADARSGDVIFPYFDANDLLHSAAEQRYVINFGIRSERDAERYAAVFDRVRTLVRPDRIKMSRPHYRERWWQFGEPRPGLTAAVESLSSVVVLPVLSKYFPAIRVPSSAIYSQRLFVVPSEEWWLYGLLLSSVHTLWAIANGSTLETRLNYTSTRCFETLPLDVFRDAVCVADAAKEFHRERERLVEAGLGQTDVYNLLHEGKVADSRTAPLREKLVELDHAVSAALGVDDDLAHLHRDTRLGRRFVPSIDASLQLQRRLVELNLSNGGVCVE